MGEVSLAGASLEKHPLKQAKLMVVVDEYWAVSVCSVSHAVGSSQTSVLNRQTHQWVLWSLMDPSVMHLNMDIDGRYSDSQFLFIRVWSCNCRAFAICEPISLISVYFPTCVGKVFESGEMCSSVSQCGDSHWGWFTSCWKQDEFCLCSPSLQGFLCFFLAFALWTELNWKAVAKHSQLNYTKTHRQCQCPYKCDRCPVSHIDKQRKISEGLENVSLFFSHLHK